LLSQLALQTTHLLVHASVSHHVDHIKSVFALRLSDILVFDDFFGKQLPLKKKSTCCWKLSLLKQLPKQDCFVFASTWSQLLIINVCQHHVFALTFQQQSDLNKGVLHACFD